MWTKTTYSQNNHSTDDTAMPLAVLFTQHMTVRSDDNYSVEDIVHYLIPLNQNDQVSLLNALVTPPNPSQKLLDAAARHFHELK